MNGLGHVQENEVKEPGEPGQREGKKRVNGKAAANAPAPAPALPVANAAEGGCLDALWTLLRNVLDLLQEAPAAACHTLTALLTLWQASSPTICRSIHKASSKPKTFFAASHVASEGLAYSQCCSVNL